MSARISSALTVLAVSTLLEGPLLHAQARELRVYISADMEGVGGVVGEQQASKGGSEYESFRELMTAEVNAAVEAALEAGASEVVVSDSHGGGQNLLVSKLHPEARLVRSFPRSLDMMHGIDESFDAALFIGYHAAAWQPGVLGHTMNGDIVGFTVNDIPMGEPGFSAAIAGHFGVPVALVTGDQVAIEGLRKLVPGIEGAEVKHAYGRTSAMTLHPTKVQQLIRERTRSALDRLGEIQPFEIEAPITLELAFKNFSTAEIAAMIPTVERIAPNEIRIVLPDMVAAAEFVALLMHIQSP